MGNPNINRRSLLATGGAGILGLSGIESVLSWQCNAAEVGKAATRTELQPLNRFPHMVQEWLVDRVREAEDRGNALRAAVQTKQDALDYVASCRHRIKECFGPFPEKTPLNARITRVIERDTYRIENVIFESRPGYFVTANLYDPVGQGERFQYLTPDLKQWVPVAVPPPTSSLVGAKALWLNAVLAEKLWFP